MAKRRSYQRLEDAQIKNMGKKLSEAVGSRGDGSLYFERQSKSSIRAFYKYTLHGASQLITIGSYKLTRTGAGFSLAQCREKARELSLLRKEHNDLKQYFEDQKAEEERQRRIREAEEERLANQGTLADLIESHVQNMKRASKKSARQVELALIQHVLTPFPKLARSKANEIAPQDITLIMKKMINNGLTTQVNRVRSYLSSAFSHGLKADLDPMVQASSDKKFYLTGNPVSPVPRQSQFERVRTRCLSHDEVRGLWNDVMKLKKHIAYRLMIRFMLATAGNRPEQLSQIKWSDIDFDKRTFTFVDLKGTRPRIQVMPLTRRAIEILEELEPVTGMYPYPFTTNGRVPVDAENLWELTAQTNRSDEDPYIPKDIRRTATNLLIEAEVTQEHRFLIQSRVDDSIEARHYANGDRLVEKRQALKAYDELLGRILVGKGKPAVTDLNDYKKLQSRELV